MANPATVQDIIKVNATISGGGGVSLQSFSDPAFVSTFDDNASFPGRVQAYAGTLAEMQASLVADGFAANDPAYRQITAAKVQQGPPDLIYIGRADPADIDYATSLTAIWDEASVNDQSLYFTCVDERDPAAIESIADWVAQRDFVFYMAATASQSVFTNQPGNVCSNIITKGYDTTALIWHDAPVASNFGPAQLRSLVGPFLLTAVSGDFKLRIDAGAEQTFTLIANPATVTGGNTGTFVVADGDEFALTIDVGLLQTVAAVMLPAAVLSGLSEPYNIPPNTTLQASFNGAPAAASTFTALQGTVTTADQPYAFLGGDTVTFSIDGGPNQVIPFAITDTTRALVVAALAPLTGVTLVDTGTGVSITSNTFGSGSDVEIVAGVANALTELGLIVGNNAGTGFAVNLAAATAIELSTKLDTDFADGTSVVDGTKVRLYTDAVGKNASVRVLDSVANDAIGFSTNEFAGAGDFNDGAAVETSEIVTWLSEVLYDVTVTNVAGAVKFDTRTRGSASSIDIPASTLGTTLGFPVALTPSVGSNVANASSVAASEISSVISLTIVGGTAGSSNGSFFVNSPTDGPTSTVELTGGTYADALFGTETFTATGTGTDEDYIDCAYVGRMSTLRLDSPNGQHTWDDQTLVGIFPDKIPANTRKVLHETLKVNTYERRLGRNEMHFGTVLFGQTNTEYRYIDQRVTIDWGWARSVETFKSTLNRLANAKSSAPNTDDGIELLATDWTRFLASGQTNGHWIYDDSTIDGEFDTGITIPTRAQQSATNVSLRKVSGFVARFQFLDSIHRVEADLNLTSFVEFTVAA